MTTMELLYDKNKRNLKLREKIENEMFINRSISQEAAYEYLNKSKDIKKSKCTFSSILPILGFIAFITYISSLLVK